ncbi:hypothetical protein [Castellaniella sp.]|uniref:hypothetical protein n=1 Tax=Castellaniella sp. TaxID=1955812 RepID=UPI002AFE6585|nr:hypothetical protein [Castellaniella sp.]
MTTSLDDFSLLVDLHGPSDLTRLPAHRSPLDATDSKLAEVLAPYDFAEPYPCGLAACRQPHQHGFLVVTVDGVETNVGKDCGRRIFGEDFAIKANIQAARASRKRQLDTLQGVLDHKEELLSRISELYDRKTGTRWANAELRSLKEHPLLHFPSNKLYAMATRGETEVIDVREATKEEKEQHRAFNPGAKSLEYTEETVGHLQGLKFLVANPHDTATVLKDKLYELTDTDAKSLSPKKLRDWVNWANGIEREFDDIEDTLANAVRFLSAENIGLLHALAAIEERNRR